MGSASLFICPSIEYEINVASFKIQNSNEVIRSRCGAAVGPVRPGHQDSANAPAGTVQAHLPHSASSIHPNAVGSLSEATSARPSEALPEVNPLRVNVLPARCTVPAETLGAVLV